MIQNLSETQFHDVYKAVRYLATPKINWFLKGVWWDCVNSQLHVSHLRQNSQEGLTELEFVLADFYQVKKVPPPETPFKIVRFVNGVWGRSPSATQK